MQTSAYIKVFGFRSRPKVVKGVIPPILSALDPAKKMAADLHLNLYNTEFEAKENVWRLIRA
jgi:hypothetical protein